MEEPATGGRRLPYLFVDARYEKVRMDAQVVSQGVLLVSAVRDDGMREILGVEVADTESEATYQELSAPSRHGVLKEWNWWSPTTTRA